MQSLAVHYHSTPIYTGPRPTWLLMPQTNSETDNCVVYRYQWPPGGSSAFPLFIVIQCDMHAQ